MKELKYKLLTPFIAMLTIFLTITSAGAEFSYINTPQFSLNITVKGTGQLIVDPDKQSHEMGQRLTIIAIPSPGWVFAYWEGDTPSNEYNSITSSAIVVTMDSDREIIAHFAKDSDNDGTSDKCEMGPDAKDPYYEGSPDQYGPDYLNPRVSSNHSLSTGNYITVASEYDMKDLETCPDSLNDLPGGIYEFIDIITQTGADGQIVIYLPEEILIKKCYIRGPSPADPSDGWQDGKDIVLIADNKITFPLWDDWENDVTYLSTALLVEDSRDYGVTSTFEKKQRKE